MGRAAALTFHDVIAQMGQAQLGHARRTRRLADTARRLSEHPGGSLPAKLHDPAAYRATLRLLNHPAVTHAAVLRPHLRATLGRLRQTTTPVLLVHDTTPLDYSNHATLASLGQIGNGGGRGYQCHNSLAVDPDTGDLLGLVCQLLHHRADAPAGEGTAARRERPDRESLLWLRAVAQIGPAPEGCHWIDVCDRGADTFEFLEYEHRHGRHFVIRSSYSRALEVEEGTEPHLLHDLLRALPGQLGWKVFVAATKKQPARWAKVLCGWTAVTLRAPHVKKGKHGSRALPVSALRVWEVEAPPEVTEPLEWILLTDEPLAGAAAARRVVGYYERRPAVEEFHKAQKTGLGIEQLQLQSQAGLQPAIALLSVLAVALVNVRQAARQPERAERPAADYVEPLWVRVLSVWRYGEQRPLTVREYVLALARLGGHLNRKCDGLPGWLTLWRGLMKLQAMVEYEQARAHAHADPGPPTAGVDEGKTKLW